MSELKSREHPVLAGLAALLGVGLVVGVITGLGAAFVAHSVGLSDGGAAPGAGAPANGGETLYAPEPSATSVPSGPQVTLAPDGSGMLVTEAPTFTGSPTASATATGISLAAAQTSVAPMQQIDLSGTYTGKDTAILQVQRFENDVWTDFPVTASVNGGTFGTYVMTSRTGENKFRVIDTDSDTASNEVVVTIG